MDANNDNDDRKRKSQSQPPTIEAPPTTRKVKKRKSSNDNQEDKSFSPLITALRLVDPLLQFLTRATGQTSVPLPTLQAVIPPAQQSFVLDNLPILAKTHGVLRLSNNNNENNHNDIDNDNTVVPIEWKNKDILIGFPQPNNDKNQNLHGSTKTAAKRRLAALKKSIKENTEKDERPSNNAQPTKTTKTTKSEESVGTTTPAKKAWKLSTEDVDNEQQGTTEQVIFEKERIAINALKECFQFTNTTTTTTTATTIQTKIKKVEIDDDSSTKAITQILPKQASYAGTNPAQTSQYRELGTALENKIPQEVLQAFRLTGKNKLCLYSHQSIAIESALNHTHTLVCTGTGSGKSLCFWIPVLQAAMTQEATSIVLFPTKALAQDQLTKLQSIICQNDALSQSITPATLDGDCSHSQRAIIAEAANIILTNPDTLHAAILPNHDKLYKRLLSNLAYIVIDEAHLYEGVFGAHVSMVFSRFYRVLMTNTSEQYRHRRRPTFVACSATMRYPEHHLRLLCPIPQQEPITIVTNDGSPRSSKHFFVWNPPLLDVNGLSIGHVELSRKKKQLLLQQQEQQQERNNIATKPSIVQHKKQQQQQHQHDANSKSTLATNSKFKTQRRHAADETALLLARAITLGIRCIAFCKTRCLVEWVYEKTQAILKKHSPKLVSKLESYRGGYTKQERRKIESKLFRNEILGVVGTNALELGVDIGGVDITLHCGYPSSFASLLQQAGRAGRGAAAAERPSFAIVVCFNSPPDQHLWRYPKGLLLPNQQQTEDEEQQQQHGKRMQTITPVFSMPIYPGLVKGHLLCAGTEYPLMGGYRVDILQQNDGSSIDDDDNNNNNNNKKKKNHNVLSDYDLFGSKQVYTEALEELLSSASLTTEMVATRNHPDQRITIYKTHPSISKPWTNHVSLRSIEPINYNIVDVSHPRQDGRMDGCVHDESAILDTLPYSRVFYHAFPGAIITHRGRRYKILSMSRPPPLLSGNCKTIRNNTMTLISYAKPSNHQYYTRPLSTLKITVVKQLERVDLQENKRGSATVTSNNIGYAKRGGQTRSTGRSGEDDKVTGASENDIKNDKKQQQQQDKASTVIMNPYMDDNIQTDPFLLGSFAGCGIVTVKRNVHGYKKISMVTREELSRSELSLPDMEYDTFAIWFDCDAERLEQVLGMQELGWGIHALSHAILAVSPLFVQCVTTDIDCNHSVHHPTKLTIFDTRAGGSGICSQLWNYMFLPENNVIQRAMELLQHCPSCDADEGYNGGCPACLQYGECSKFNDYISRSSAIIIGKRLLERLQQTNVYQSNVQLQQQEVAHVDGEQLHDELIFNNTPKKTPQKSTLQSPSNNSSQGSSSSSPLSIASNSSSPRDMQRARAMVKAKDMQSAKNRAVVVGRPSWPTQRCYTNSNNNNSSNPQHYQEEALD